MFAVKKKKNGRLETERQKSICLLVHILDAPMSIRPHPEHVLLGHPLR